MLCALTRFVYGLVLTAVIWSSYPATANALELFGFNFFGSSESDSEDTVDPVAYSAVLVVETGAQSLTDKLESGSLLLRGQNDPPSGTIGLISRARDDQSNILALLYEQARYAGTVSIMIGGRPMEEISVTDTLRPFADKVPVTITVRPGPPFRFGTIRLEGDDGSLARTAATQAGLARGEPASSLKIAAAETAITRAWQEAGHPFARIRQREVVADHKSMELDVALHIESGTSARLGDVRIKGTVRLDPEFLSRQAQVPTGQPYHPERIERIRKNIAKLDAVGSVSVEVGQPTGKDGLAPVIIEVSERKRRTIGAGALYSSTEGATVETFWLHRNLFGNAETIRVDASIGRLIEADSLDEYDALFSVLYSVPGFLHPSNRLDLKATALQEDPDPYNRRGVVAEAHLRHDLNERTTISGGMVFDWARIDDAFGRNFYTLVSLPFDLTYDTRNNVLDPTSGIYASLKLEPQLETSSTSFFFLSDAELRTYYALDDDGRVVLAARGKVGTITGADLVDIPAHRRFYAGGGGSVRGYDYLNVGPRISGFGATGGLSRIEGSLEARLKVSDTFGIVPFVDAGLVTANTAFGGIDDFQVGAGVGLRYYTAVGPIRLDVAVPLDPRSGDPDFAIYAGIGQAF